jgi:hypothetical protein
MKRLRIHLTEIEQRIVVDERESYPDPCVRRKLSVLWLLHCGTTREKAVKVVSVVRSTVERYVAEFREGGLDGFLGSVIPDIDQPANSLRMPTSSGSRLKDSQPGPSPRLVGEFRNLPA